MAWALRHAQHCMLELQLGLLLKHVGSLTPTLVHAAGGPEIKPRGTVTETLGVVVISSAIMKHGAGRY